MASSWDQDSGFLFDLAPELPTEDLVVPDPVDPPVSEKIVWPTFQSTGNATADDKQRVAEAIIDFIEAGFPQEKWGSRELLSLLHGPFSTSWSQTTDTYWRSHLSNSARQANWMLWLKTEAQRRQKQGSDVWADVEQAVLDVIDARGYYTTLRDSGRVLWSPPMRKTGAQFATDLNQYKFESNEFHSGNEKAEFATRLIQFIESDFSEAKFTKKLYNQLHGLFRHIAHYDKFGFFEEWFSTQRDQLDWFNNVLTQSDHWDDFRHGDFHAWRDVEAALAEVVKDRGYVEQWTEKVRTALEQSERAELDRLSRKYGDSPAITAPSTDLFGLSL